MDPGWLAGIGSLTVTALVLVMLWREQTKTERQRLLDAIAAERAERAKLVDEFKENTTALATLTGAVTQMQWGMNLLIGRSEERRESQI